MKLMKLTGIATVIAMSMAACTSGPAVETQTDDATEFDDDFEDEDVLAVPLEQSPSGGATFDFCPNAGPAQPIQLRNAAWMAFMAANEYAHLGYIAPMLVDLGFGSPGDAFWRPCGQALREVRAWEAANVEALEEASGEGAASVKGLVAWAIDPANPDQWSVCAREYVEQSGYDGTVYPAAGMEEWLIQTTDPNNGIQFFSGGEIADLGRAFAQGGTQALYARHDEKDVAVFSFRGTEPDQLEDIATDLKAWDVSLANHGFPKGWGEVHAGFFEAFETLRVQLDARLEQLEGTGTGIWVTGHSLGGGLGTLMTAHILKEIENGRDLNLRGLYTFGSPRVGGKYFQGTFEDLMVKHDVKVGRVRNDNDVVTHVPGSLGGWQGWRHVGTRVYLTRLNLSFPEEQPDYSGLLGLGSAADHSMVAQAEDGSPAGYYDRLVDYLGRDYYAETYATCP